MLNSFIYIYIYIYIYISGSYGVLSFRIINDTEPYLALFQAVLPLLLVLHRRIYQLMFSLIDVEFL